MLQEKLAEAEENLRKITQEIREVHASRAIDCASCDASHRIRDLDAVQTYWYVAPHGCTEGDYWSPGEIQYICPKTKVRNRILFHANAKLADQFRCLYGDLFKSVISEYEDSHGPTANNYYIAKHLGEFELSA